MAEESLNFRHNACRIDVRVAGSASEASGFVYRTKPSCDYDYVFTVKHAFQEGEEKPSVKKLSRLTLRYGSDSKNRIELYDKHNLDDCLYFVEDIDMVIIRVKKQLISKVKRIAVKNAADTHTDDEMCAHAFITIHREESTLLNCEWKEKELGIFKVDDIETIERYGGASGSGIYSKNEPYLIGLLSGYRLPEFEQKELLMVKPDWGKINEELFAKKWTRLNAGKAQLTTISEDREVIDIRELDVNGAVLDMEKAIEMLNEVKESIINAYEIKTGQSRTVLSHLMEDETWMNAKKAIELHFADGILEDSKKDVPVEAYAFASKSFDMALVNKIASKTRKEEKTGRDISELKNKLTTIKKLI